MTAVTDTHGAPDREPQRHSLAQQAEEVLRGLVLSGEIPPGQRLNEVELAQRLHISRGPLREAIRHLTSEGMLTYEPHRGTFVLSNLDETQLRELFELRSALECAAVQLAARRRTDRDLARLRAVTQQARRDFDTDGGTDYQYDLAFHQTVLEAAHSSMIADQVRLVQQQIVLLRSAHQPDPGHERASLDDHDQLVTALAEGDGPQAAQLMAAHLDRVREQMVVAMADAARA